MKETSNNRSGTHWLVKGFGHFLSVVGFKCIKMGMWVEIFIPWHKIFASGATKDHFKQETYHPKLWLKQKEVWRHHFSAFLQSSTVLTLLSPVEASNSKKKNPAKESFVRNLHVFSIHKTANSPTENASKCRFRNHVTESLHFESRQGTSHCSKIFTNLSVPLSATTTLVFLASVGVDLMLKHNTHFI